MASEREHTPLSEQGAMDVEITHPNRDKPVVQATRATVILLMVATAALVAIVTIGGWAVLQAAKPIEVVYVLVYVTMAFLAIRWNRGVLPVSAVLAVLLGIFAVVAAPGWFSRDKSGFEQPALSAGLLGVLTLLIVPVQVLLVGFAMRGFQQGWNVEVERRRPGSGRAGARAADPDVQY
jgi:presenilin-like A22 family membrane protease